MRLVRAHPTPTLLIEMSGRLLAVSDSWITLLREAGVSDTIPWQPEVDLFAALHDAKSAGPGAAGAYAELATRLREALTTPVSAREYAVPFPGGSRWFIVNSNQLSSDGPWVLSLTDISQRRLVERRLEHEANHDGLTGLPNRSALALRLRALAENRRENDRLDTALMFLDLDDFKTVNDNHGHAAGDAVLAEVASRLRGAVRAADFVARLGGDEFVVVISQTAGELEVLAYAERLLETLRPPIAFDGQPLSVTASVGIALSSADDPDTVDLLRDADIAMLKAKTQGSRRLVFNEVLTSSRRKHADATSALRGAIERGNVQAWFQPVVRLADGEVVGAEALVRWVQGDGELVMPAAFVPLAEATGLIGPMDRRVMMMAAQALVRGPLEHLASCSVNVSPLQIASGLILDEVRELLTVTGIEPGRLVAEITETAVLSDPRAARTHLLELKELGVMTALDDFGTGYSSLAHLANLPIDVVKLDRSFVSRLGRHRTSEEITRAVVQLGQALGLVVVAEGVETAEQHEALIAMGCERAQGFLYGAAVPADEFASRTQLAEGT